MTEEEFKKQIGFREDRDVYGLRIVAGVKLYRSLVISASSKSHDPARIQSAKDRLTEELLRWVYEDRRKEIHDALMDLHKANPFSIEFHEAIDKVMRLAKRQ